MEETKQVKPNKRTWLKISGATVILFLLFMLQQFQISVIAKQINENAVTSFISDSCIISHMNILIENQNYLSDSIINNSCLKLYEDSSTVYYVVKQTKYKNIE